MGSRLDLQLLYTNKIAIFYAFLQEVDIYYYTLNFSPSYIFSFFPSVSGVCVCMCVRQVIVCLLQTDLSSSEQGDRSLCVSQ